MPGKYFSSKPFEFVFLDILQRKGKNTLVCDFVACPFTDNIQTRLKKLRLLIPFRHSKFHAERGIKLLKGLFAIHNSRPLKKTWHQMEYLIIKITVFNWLYVFHFSFLLAEIAIGEQQIGLSSCHI